MGLYFDKHFANTLPAFFRWVPKFGIWVRLQMVLREKRRARKSA
jgi:hypothetical protein